MSVTTKNAAITEESINNFFQLEIKEKNNRKTLEQKRAALDALMAEVVDLRQNGASSLRRQNTNEME